LQPPIPHPAVLPSAILHAPSLQQSILHAPSLQQSILHAPSLQQSILHSPFAQDAISHLPSLQQPTGHSLQAQPAPEAHFISADFDPSMRFIEQPDLQLDVSVGAAVAFAGSFSD
jgi:hypothetical protein